MFIYIPFFKLSHLHCFLSWHTGERQTLVANAILGTHSLSSRYLRVKANKNCGHPKYVEWIEKLYFFTEKMEV